MFSQSADKFAQVVTTFYNFINQVYSALRIAAFQKIGHTKINFLVDDVECLQQFGRFNIVAAERTYLVEYTLCIPKRSIGAFGDHHQGVTFNGDGFCMCDSCKCLDNFFNGDASEIEPLTAGKNRHWYFVHFRCGKYKYDVRRRFFKRFEESVECFLRQHVHFIDDVDFIFAAGRRIPDGITEISDFFHSAVGGAVNFNDVEPASFNDFLADLTNIIRILVDRGKAVERTGKNAGCCCFAAPACPAENIRMRDTVRRNRIAKSICHVALTNDIVEDHRPPFTSCYLITHFISNEKIPYFKNTEFRT